MADSGPNIAPFLNLALQIIHATGGETKRADEAAHILASSTAVNTYPAVKGLVKALETAAARFNLMGGVGLVNGADPKVGYQEAMDALSRFRSLQNGGAN